MRRGRWRGERKVGGREGLRFARSRHLSICERDKSLNAVEAESSAEKRPVSLRAGVRAGDPTPGPGRDPGPGPWAPPDLPAFP